MIDVRPFDSFVNSPAALTYTIRGAHSSIKLSNFGATILGISVPDVYGTQADVVLGYSLFDLYLDNPACFGASIGPSANRTDKAEIPLNGVIYHLSKNNGLDNQNNLHTDLVTGIHKRIWQTEIDEAHNTVKFSIDLVDGEYGLPGNRHITATYELVEDAAHSTVNLTYTCTTDAATFVNMTNHVYFNLNGHDSGNVCGHQLTINADSYLPLREDSVSAGTIDSVVGTPFDFRTPKTIGRDLRQENKQLNIAHGYDHCFVINNYEDGQLRPALLATSENGRSLEIQITAPGAHLYTGNWLDEARAKDGATYKPQAGFAFESEFYPDCAHHEKWPQPTCTPEQSYSSQIVYRFF